MIVFKDYFYYDEDSPTFLKHKIERRNVKKDSIAGSLTHHSGYSSVRLFNKMYQTHRIIWCLCNNLESIDSKLEIDHIDGNRLNNKIENLRLVESSDNKKNRSIFSNNTSGFCGVSFNPKGYWMSHWYENEKFKCNYFSIKEFGDERAKQLAINHRKTKIDYLKTTESYTERHGK